MKTIAIRMRTTSAGPTGSMLAGNVYNVDQATAASLVRGRYAELVDGRDVTNLETGAIRSARRGSAGDETRRPGADESQNRQPTSSRKAFTRTDNPSGGGA